LDKINWSEVDGAPSQIPTLPTKSKVDRWQRVPPGMIQYQILSEKKFHFDHCDPQSPTLWGVNQGSNPKTHSLNIHGSSNDPDFWLTWNVVRGAYGIWDGVPSVHSSTSSHNFSETPHMISLKLCHNLHHPGCIKFVHGISKNGVPWVSPGVSPQNRNFLHSQKLHMQFQ